MLLKDKKTGEIKDCGFGTKKGEKELVVYEEIAGKRRIRIYKTLAEFVADFADVKK